jgi:hypothetical protein
MHFVSASCRGENCGMCYRFGRTRDATHKVGEEIPHDDPNPIRHNLTQYICCRCFMFIVGRHMAPCDREPITREES